MDVDVCYKVSENNVYKELKRYVDSDKLPLAIYSAVDDLYINKKTIWNALDSLRSGGVLAIMVKLYQIDTVIGAAKGILNNIPEFDVVVFHSDIVKGRSGPCFYESCMAFVLMYKDHPPLLWKLPNPANLYNMNPNIIKIDSPIDESYNYSGHEVMRKLLETTDIGDVVLLIGDDSLHYVGDIKNLHRYVVGFGNSKIEAMSNEGMRIVNLGV